MNQYDYIIIGAGCAGLSLLMRIIDSDAEGEKKILLVDKAEKNTNDRTWCFWERSEGYFENIVYRKWSGLFFKTESVSKKLGIGDYAYKMVRGIDFYNYCFSRIAKCPNIEILNAHVAAVDFDNNECVIHTLGEPIRARAAFVFSSIFEKPVIKDTAYYLLQHFKGWVIETADQVFKEGEATFMDFSVEQRHEAVFVYMLPLSKQQALVEYTVFSKEALAQEEYDSELKQYIKQHLNIDAYKVIDTEFGVIPMTNHVFPFRKNGVHHIGTAGGQTKASTGYTFRFIQKQSECISKALAKGDTKITDCYKTASRFRYYDSILLNVLCSQSMTGKEIFFRLFSAVPASQIFKFLDNETTLAEEMKILNAMPFSTFLPAAIREMINKTPRRRIPYFCTNDNQIHFNRRYTIPFKNRGTKRHAGGCY